MSYSRWGVSCWYTFWATNSGDTKEEQMFQICGFPSIDFHYIELKEDIDFCMIKVMKDYPKSTKRELDELRVYMRHFIEDIEEEFK